MSERFVVVGSGRSGTKYMSELLSAAGVPCGHEQVFDFDPALESRWAGRVADASWMAVPRLPIEGVPAVLVTRHPLLVVRSWVEIGFFGDRLPEQLENRCHEVLRGWAPEVYGWPAECDRALAMWTRLNRHALPHAGRRCQLEEMTASAEPLRDLLGWLGRPVDRAARAFASVGVENRHETLRVRSGVSHPLSWGVHDPVLADVARGLAVELGYDPDVVPSPAGAVSVDA